MHTKKISVRVGTARYGRGVFALRPIAAGEQVGEVEGEVIDNPDYGSEYAIDLGDATSLEPAAPFRYLNHACAPNCELVIYDAEDDDGQPLGPMVCVEALRDIAASEQLTIDYAWPADAAIPCQCGTSACRGWIVHADSLETLLTVSQ